MCVLPTLVVVMETYVCQPAWRAMTIDCSGGMRHLAYVVVSSCVCCVLQETDSDTQPTLLCVVSWQGSNHRRMSV